MPATAQKAIAVIIPARYASSRLPGKPLLDLAGKPMIQHVYERAMQAQVAHVVVATDDERIVSAVQAFGGQVVMTSPSHPSGTDRVAEAARSLQADIIVNVQGDEPLLDPQVINQVAAPLVADATLVMATAAHPLHEQATARDPNVVKVVCNRQGNALYFSRAPIPYDRDPAPKTAPLLRHLGLYAYRADFLQKLATLPPTPLEQRERLEQLRVLEEGYLIRVVITEQAAIGVDTPADAEQVRRLLAR
ncbi:3-deoxy-manno-octulosonate cytidylyltransferase [Candidatus Magnetaquicoccus inordinatus]|uniref:3-deoxy-manno-octulosonate cytidylyltransferase n=1 Tax=Candidatus Magnetaquicoccus inordinatus TaxID=2496818 RepID=UPI001D0E0914|nr:3-deoxy-manno-octulosonate cytidylyltransferase [Candidatus Magnetaquicoccus inordinatus]